MNILSEEKVVKSDIISEYLQKNNISKTNFCNSCKISQETFKKVMTGKLNYNMTILFKISQAMDCSIKDLLK